MVVTNAIDQIERTRFRAIHHGDARHSRTRQRNRHTFAHLSGTDDEN